MESLPLLQRGGKDFGPHVVEEKLEVLHATLEREIPSYRKHGISQARHFKWRLISNRNTRKT